MKDLLKQHISTFHSETGKNINHDLLEEQASLAIEMSNREYIDYYIPLIATYFCAKYAYDVENGDTMAFEDLVVGTAYYSFLFNVDKTIIERAAICCLERNINRVKETTTIESSITRAASLGRPKHDVVKMVKINYLRYLTDLDHKDALNKAILDLQSTGSEYYDHYFAEMLAKRNTILETIKYKLSTTNTKWN